MATDAEIEAAVVAMRAIRVKGAKVHEEVMRAYARAAIEAEERARKEDFQRRAQLNNKPTAPTAEGARTGLGHGVYRDSIYPAKSRGDPEKTQNCRQRPRGLVAEAPEGQGSGAQRAEVSPWDSPISLACRGRDMGEAA